MSSKIIERYLKIGLRIQTDAKNSLSLIIKEEDKLKSINKNLLSITKELENIKKNSMNYDNIEAIQSDIFKQLNNMEIQSEILNKSIAPLNIKMEELNKEEEMLWSTVKEKYSNLDDEEIIKQFTDYIKDNQ